MRVMISFELMRLRLDLFIELLCTYLKMLQILSVSTALMMISMIVSNSLAD
jgi:hypothetical protein